MDTDVSEENAKPLARRIETVLCSETAVKDTQHQNLEQYNKNKNVQKLQKPHLITSQFKFFCMVKTGYPVN
jgi:hypothetical protein